MNLQKMEFEKKQIEKIQNIKFELENAKNNLLLQKETVIGKKQENYHIKQYHTG